MWLVYNLTNYGDGIYFGGLYRSRQRAEERLAYCEKKYNSDCDSWSIAWVHSMPKDAEIE